ncbi:hypothetical protein EYF80_026906 [Liparis tanakae]|uniref:Uncharacterized protein n=1 Tax=Liparis tanakae TaxID=230148 RepID=A0A4Z2HB31_9TELE|nr:hypothetical protein EYF80_026906 [Liparis tanakae]
MLDVTHGFSILNVGDPHPIHLLLHTGVQLLLREEGRTKNLNATDVFQASRHDAVWLVKDFLQVKAYLGGPEAEGCGLDVGFLFVHQQQGFVFYETQREQSDTRPCDREGGAGRRLLSGNLQEKDNRKGDEWEKKRQKDR